MGAEGARLQLVPYFDCTGFVRLLASATGTAILFVTTLSLLKQGGQDACERHNESDQKESEPHRAPERDVARRTGLVGDVGVSDAAGDQSEDDETAGEDVKIAAHANSPILLDAGC